MIENNNSPPSSSSSSLELDGKKRHLNDKRAEQNRKAQRTFRQKKAEYLKSLEEKVEFYEKEFGNLEKLKAENEQLKQLLSILQQQQKGFNAGCITPSTSTETTVSTDPSFFNLASQVTPEITPEFGQSAFDQLDILLRQDQPLNFDNLPKAFGGNADFYDFFNKNAASLSLPVDEQLPSAFLTSADTVTNINDLFDGEIKPFELVPTPNEQPKTESACERLDKVLNDDTVNALCDLMAKVNCNEKPKCEITDKYSPEILERKKKFWGKIMKIAAAQHKMDQKMKSFETKEVSC